MLLSLQASPVNTPETQSLQYLISRINEQRGGFRNVSEHDLEEEIEAGGDEGAIQEDEDSSDADEEVRDVIPKKERVSKAREEMLRQVGQAQNESATALDFVSLLLSSRTPGPAALTLSPYIKQHLPLGCLGVETVQSINVSELQKEQDEMVSMGWRMQSLNNTADSLLKSASRLENEMQKETTYWDQVLAIKAKGWALSRLPREKYTLGVHYGFAEAHQSFRDRGLAALRRDEDGSLSLDRGHRSSNKSLRIRQLMNGEPTMTNSDLVCRDREGGSLEREILDARNSIYDEELFHELHREAQHLANQGVVCVNSSINLPFGKDCQIEIALEPHGTSKPIETQNRNSIPDITYLVLRLLLSLAHLQNLHDRSQPPPPIRQGQGTRTVYPILKPVVELLIHRSHLASIHALLCSFRACMERAGLPFAIKRSTVSPDFDIGAGAPKHTAPARLQTTWELVARLTSNTIEIDLLDQVTPLKFSIQTAISSPNFGTTYKIFQGAESEADIVTSCSSPQDLEIELSDLLRKAIKRYIVGNIPTWRNAEVGIELLSKHDHSGKSRDNIIISMNRDHVGLAWGRNSDIGQQQFKWSWYASADHESEEQPLRKILEDLDSA